MPKSKTPTFTDQYLELQEKYERKYGKDTILLLQNGEFYQTYECDMPGEKPIGNAVRISKLLNYSLAQPSVYIGSRSKPKWCGFKKANYENDLQVLVDAGMTVVRMDQLGVLKNGGSVERKLVEVITPGTNIYSKKTSNYICCIAGDPTSKDCNVLGISIADFSTGEVITQEFTRKETNPNYINEELNRIMSTYRPSETIRNYKTKECKNLDFQRDLFSRTYAANALTGIDVIEYLGLDMLHSARLSLAMLFAYAHDHSPMFLSRVQNPQLGQKKYMTITNNAIDQLMIDKLIEILDRCETAMGRRYLRKLAMEPTTDVHELGRRYDIVEAFRPRTDELRKKLRPIMDLSRLVRLINLRRMDFTRFHGLHCTVAAVLQLAKYMTKYWNNCQWWGVRTIKHDFDGFKNRMKKFLKKMKKIFVLENLENNSKENIFQKNYSKKVDEILSKISEGKSKLENIAAEVETGVQYGKVKNKICIDYKDQLGYYLRMSKTQFGKVSHEMKLKYSLIDKNNRTINRINTGNEFRFRTPVISECSNNVVAARKIMDTVISEEWDKTMEMIENKYSNLFSEIENFVTEVDVFHSLARVSIENGYKCPEVCITEESTGPSRLQSENIRHPIVEKIIDVPYVGNRIVFNEQRGFLLYGPNKAGKSTLMKSIGLNVIMAQMGSYVAADSFEFVPFDNIITRISGDDDMLAGKSSFEVEMLELRTILRNSHSRSLVLGDEICKGTETASAIAIVTAAVRRLAASSACFIFATHLHELNRIEEITELKSIRFQHMAIDYNSKLDIIVFTRKLREGSGSDLYGIEIARDLDLGSDFIGEAMKLRNRLINNKLFAKKSRYNSKLFVRECYLCGSRKKLETHHIREQYTADSRGMIGHFHKNELHNLVILCHKCHKKQQLGKIEIKEFVKANRSRKLR